MTGTEAYNKMQESVKMVELAFDDNNPKKYKRIPLSEVPFLGAGVWGIAELLKEKSIKEAIEQTPELYAAVNIHGRGHMTNTKDGSGLLLGTITDEHGIVGQMRFLPYTDVSNNTNVSSGAVVCAVAAVGVAFYVIEQRVISVYDKLDNIERSIEVKSESALRARYQALYKIFKEYPYYADNESARNAKLNQITRAEDCSGDIFEEYKDKLKKLSDKNPNKKHIEKMIAYIYYLLAAVKVYSLANYLEILYSDNFQEGLISSKKEDVENMLNDYYEVCNNFWEYIKRQGEKNGKVADFLYEVGINCIKSIGSFSSKSYSAVNYMPSVSSDTVSDGFKFLFTLKEQTKYKPIYDEMLGDTTLGEVGLDRFDSLNKLVNEDNSFAIDGTYLYLLAS